jgi:hypothetical protein
VTKKKTNKLTPSVEQLIAQIDLSAELDEVSEYLTLVMWELNPAINKAATYDLLWDALSGESTVDPRTLGLAIKATAHESLNPVTH